MTKEEILKYIFLCISYKHNNDISPYITKSACEKENLLFENAIEFLDKLEKENAELEAYNEKLLDGDIEKHNKIVELKEQVDALVNVNIKAQNIIGKAKEIIKRLLKATYGEGWNYSLDVKVKAEDFLKELENE